MAVTPTSRIALIVDAVRTLVATSETFQTITGTAGDPDPVAAARAFVHLFAVNNPTLPYAIVSFGGFSETDATLGSKTGDYTFIVEFVGGISDANAADDAHADAANAFLNDFGEVLDEMDVLSKGSAPPIGPLVSINPGELERTKRSDRAGIGEEFRWDVELVVNLAHGI